MVFSRSLLGLVTLTVIAIIAAETPAEDTMGWTLLGKTLVDLKPLSLSILNLKGDSGFQLALASGSLKFGATQHFSISLGYDDMVASPQHGGMRQGVPITEQLFLLQTSCDKRFQVLLQFRW
jgi:hypothetical protein